MSASELRDLGEIRARLLGHRPVIRGETCYFVKEFEEKRGAPAMRVVENQKNRVGEAGERALPRCRRCAGEQPAERGDGCGGPEPPRRSRTSQSSRPFKNRTTAATDKRENADLRPVTPASRLASALSSAVYSAALCRGSESW